MLWAGLALLSYQRSSASIDEHLREVAVSEGRFVFLMVESARLWNARHGGLYARVTPSSPPNPYLEVPERDIRTPSGIPLTVINPAYMTRQMGDVILERTDTRIHLTSLTPLNPANKATPWEGMALKQFEQGHKEFFRFMGEGELTRAQYMAPLVTLAPCLQCHAKQGYRVGDIRGGISVSYPVGQLVQAMQAQKQNSAWVHLSAWFLLTGLTLIFVLRARGQIEKLQAAKALVDKVVEERTIQLQAEVLERDRAESRMRLLINSSGEGIMELDRYGDITLCNPAALRMLDYADDASLLGKPITDYLAPLSTERQDAMDHRTDLFAYQRGLALHRDDVRLLRADNSTLRVELRMEPLYKDGKVVGAVLTFNDITLRKLQEEQVWRQANYDPLTGLPNRSLLSDRLEQGLAQCRRRNLQLAVLFLDLDDFKPVNDAHGHEAGDELLRQLAQRLLHTVRDSDTVARLGGDEFVVVQPMLADTDGVRALAEKLIETISKPYDIAGREVRISVSIGVAIHPSHGHDAPTLLKHADTAMYQAKEAGRHTWRIYDPKMNRHGEKH